MILELRDAVSNIVSRPSDVAIGQSIAPNVENRGAMWSHDEAATVGGEAKPGLQGPINYPGKGANDGMPDAWAAAAGKGSRAAVVAGDSGGPDSADAAGAATAAYWTRYSATLAAATTQYNASVAAAAAAAGKGSGNKGSGKGDGETKG